MIIQILFLVLSKICLTRATILDGLLQQKQPWSNSGGSEITGYGLPSTVTVPESLSGPEFLYWLTHLSRNPDIIRQLIQKYEELSRTLETTTNQHRSLLENIDLLQSDYCPEGTKSFENICVSLLKREIMSFYEAKLKCQEAGGDLISGHLTNLNGLLEAIDVDPKIDITFYVDLELRNGVYYLKDGTRAKFDSLIALPKDYPYANNCYQLAVWQHETKLKATSCYYLKQPVTPVSYAVCQFPKLKGKSVNDYVKW